MRLLTTEETRAVSGGSINGQDDPYSLTGNNENSDTGNSQESSCDKIKSDRKRDNCYADQARSEACPGGWTGPEVTASVTGFTITGRTCDTGTSSNSGGASDNGGNGGAAGNGGNGGGAAGHGGNSGGRG